MQRQRSLVYAQSVLSIDRVYGKDSFFCPHFLHLVLSKRLAICRSCLIVRWRADYPVTSLYCFLSKIIRFLDTLSRPSNEQLQLPHTWCGSPVFEMPLLQQLLVLSLSTQGEIKIAGLELRNGLPDSSLASVFASSLY